MPGRKVENENSLYKLEAAHACNVGSDFRATWTESIYVFLSRAIPKISVLVRKIKNLALKNYIKNVASVQTMFKGPILEIHTILITAQIYISLPMSLL